MFTISVSCLFTFVYFFADSILSPVIRQRQQRRMSPESDSENLDDFEMISEEELAEVSPWTPLIAIKIIYCVCFIWFFIHWNLIGFFSVYFFYRIIVDIWIWCILIGIDRLGSALKISSCSEKRRKMTAFGPKLSKNSTKKNLFRAFKVTKDFNFVYWKSTNFFKM